MRRGSKRAKAKVEATPPVARKPRRNEGSRVGDLEKRLAESLAQQTATAEILEVISSSLRDVQPVFDAIVHSAVRLCDGLFSTVFRFDGKLVHLVAHHNFAPEALAQFKSIYPTPPAPAGWSAKAAPPRAPRPR